jgi:hypothetical protein
MYHFGEIGILFTALKYPKITIPRLKITYLKDKSGILKNLYLDDFKCYIKKKERLREKKIATFAFIFGQMTEESKQICARDPKYDRAVLTQTCPLKLWNIILRTHLSEQTGHSLMNRFVARRAYETLRQDDGETLLNFKTRYEEALKTLKATGEKTPSDEDQAINFLEKLDQNKFAEFGAGLHNDAANKQEMGVPDTFPNTLAKMYAVASRYMVVVNKPRVPTGTVGTAAVFTATIAELDTIDRDDDRRPAATIKSLTVKRSQQMTRGIKPETAPTRRKEMVAVAARSSPRKGSTTGSPQGHAFYARRRVTRHSPVPSVMRSELF